MPKKIQIPKAPDCILCATWQRFPFHKRPTTPVSGGDTEAVLIAGYFAHMVAPEDAVEKLCDRHAIVLAHYKTQHDTAQRALEATTEMVEEEKARQEAADVHRSRAQLTLQRARPPVEKVEPPVPLPKLEPTARTTFVPEPEELQPPEQDES